MKNKQPKTPAVPMTKAEVRKEIKKIGVLCGLLLILSCVFIWQTSVFKMDSESMSPTFEKGQHILVNRLAKEYRSGDLIAYVVRYPMNKEAVPEVKIKRLIGFPGDDIGVKEGYLYVNNEKNVQITTNGEEWDKDQEITSYSVPDDSYFIVYDNLSYKPEIGEFSFIYKTDVIGKVLFAK